MTSPQQSRSIAIKRSRSNQVYSEEPVDRTLYDLATWRMYNRIMTYRKQRPSSDTSQSESSDLQPLSSNLCGEMMEIQSSPVSDRRPSSQRSEYDEQIFQLDL